MKIWGHRALFSQVQWIKVLSAYKLTAAYSREFRKWSLKAWLGLWIYMHSLSTIIFLPFFHCVSCAFVFCIYKQNSLFFFCLIKIYTWYVVVIYNRFFKKFVIVLSQLCNGLQKASSIYVLVVQVLGMLFSISLLDELKRTQAKGWGGGLLLKLARLDCF